MATSVTLLGATGSIGRQTADIVVAHPDEFSVVAVTANRSSQGLAEVALRTKAGFAAIADESAYRGLQEALSGTSIECAAGDQAIIEAASRQADKVVAGISGTAGLAPTLAAVASGADILLANKEALVVAGEWFRREVGKSKARLLPVDSEHNALFRLLEKIPPSQVAKLVLTASGGPFLGFTADALESVTPEQALKHPIWSMGRKNAIDSATLANKGLELIEAHFLFDMPESAIETWIHPQSLLHGMVICHDGASFGHFSRPDMNLSLAHALFYSDSAPHSEPLSLHDLSRCEFLEPDTAAFPALRLARSALRSGGATPAVFSIANEIAVEAFLAQRIGFNAIHRFIDQALAAIGTQAAPQALDEVAALEAEATRLFTSQFASQLTQGNAPATRSA